MQTLVNFNSLQKLLEQRLSDEQKSKALESPIFILSAPRAGSSMLFECLTTCPYFSNIGGESHVVYRNFPHLRFASSQMESASLGRQHADPKTVSHFRDNFLFLLQNNLGVRLIEQPEIFAMSAATLIEKTPRNALNIPFLLQVFPDARFIFLHRKPEENIASLIEAWEVGLKSGRFATFPNLPGWDRPAWCFLLPDGWQQMRGKSLTEIAAFQWEQSNTIIYRNLNSLEKSRWISISYQALIDNRQNELTRLFNFVGLDLQTLPTQNAMLPLSRSTLSAPDKDKWRKHEKQIIELLPHLQPISTVLQKLS
jgi:hypothetical protein